MLRGEQAVRLSVLRLLAGNDLLSAWLTLRAGLGNRPTDNAADLNVDLARLGQYRRAARSVPADRQRQMRRDVLSALFSDDVAAQLALLLEVR